MTIKILDAAFETTTTTGTGDITLAGALSGFRSFSVAGNGSYVAYQINDGNAAGVVTQREVGIGIITVGSPNTLKRSKILYSTNSNQAVNFGTGTKNVLGSIPADILAVRDENLNLLEGFGVGAGTATAHTVNLPVVPLAYSDGMRVYYYPPALNTGAFTVNVNSLGNKSVKFAGADPVAGVVVTNTALVLIYNANMGFFDIQPTATMITGLTALSYGTKAVATNGQIATSGVIINLGTEEFDDLNWHDNATNNSRITVDFTGRIQVDALFQGGMNGAGNYFGSIYKNGSPFAVTSGYVPSAQSAAAFCSQQFNVVPGDYFQMYAATSGPTLTVSNASTLCVRRIK